MVPSDTALNIFLAPPKKPAPDVVAAASWRAREWLGFSGLEEGAEADFVVLDRDPRADLSVLAEPERVVLRGSVVAAR